MSAVKHGTAITSEKDRITITLWKNGAVSVFSVKDSFGYVHLEPEIVKSLYDDLTEFYQSLSNKCEEG